MLVQLVLVPRVAEVAGLMEATEVAGLTEAKEVADMTAAEGGDTNLN